MRHTLTILTIVVLLAAPLAAVEFTSVYKAPNAAPTSFAGKKVVVLMMTDDDSLRMSAEESLVRILTGRNVQAVASYRAIPRELLRNVDLAKRWFQDAAVEGVVVLRPIQLETTVTKYAPQWTGGYYDNFWSYYGYTAVAVYTPAHTERETTVVVETLVYHLKRDVLLWGAVSVASNPKSMDAYMKELVGDAVKELRKVGLIAK